MESCWKEGEDRVSREKWGEVEWGRGGALISHEGDRVLRTGDRTAGRVWVISGD